MVATVVHAEKEDDNGRGARHAMGGGGPLMNRDEKVVVL
jgi:hypothetical protein